MTTSPKSHSNKVSDFTRLEEAFQLLLSANAFSADGFSPEVIAALALASTTFQSVVRAKNNKTLICAFEAAQDAKVKIKVSLVTRLYEVAESLFRTAKNAYISVEWSPEAVTQIIEDTRDTRLSLPQTLQVVRREAKRIHAKLSLHLNPPPFSVEDLEHELYVYLLDNAERNFRPERSSYPAYISMTLKLRGKRLYSKILRNAFREPLITSSNDSDESEYIEYLMYKSPITTLYQLPGVSSDLLETNQLINKLQTQLSTSEKTILLLSILRNGNLAGVFNEATLSSQLTEKIQSFLEH